MDYGLELSSDVSQREAPLDFNNKFFGQWVIASHSAIYMLMINVWLTDEMFDISLGFGYFFLDEKIRSIIKYVDGHLFGMF